MNANHDCYPTETSVFEIVYGLPIEAFAWAIWPFVLAEMRPIVCLAQGRSAAVSEEASGMKILMVAIGYRNILKYIAQARETEINKFANAKHDRQSMWSPAQEANAADIVLSTEA
jgi:hypothetical protein